MKTNWIYYYEDANQGRELTRERASYLLRSARSRRANNIERLTNGYRIVDANVSLFKVPSLDVQLDGFLRQWEGLVNALIPDIEDDFRASDEDEEPSMQLTIGFTPATPDRDASWSYQTGDNSFTGGAYGSPYWAVVSLYRDTDAAEMAEEIASQLAELIWQ